MDPVAHGELLAVPERVIIAPAPGRFRPLSERDQEGDGAAGTVETAMHAEDQMGDPVDQEQVIGYVDGIGHSTPVRSPFPGRLMGLLAHAGERVREGQPVAWLRLAH